jgi:hypothetical protein
VIFTAWPQGVTIKYNNWMCISFCQIIKVHLTNLSEGCTFIPWNTLNQRSTVNDMSSIILYDDVR